MIITREQYDLLLRHAPEYMRTGWLNLVRDYHVSCVIVDGTDFEVQYLQLLLHTAELNADATTLSYGNDK